MKSHLILWAVFCQILKRIPGNTRFTHICMGAAAEVIVRLTNASPSLRLEKVHLCTWQPVE